MSTSKHHSSRIKGTGKVLALQSRTPVPSHLAKQCPDRETSVIPFRRAEQAGVENAWSGLPETNRPAADVLPFGNGRGCISPEKASGAAITELLDAVRTGNAKAACLWLWAGDYSVLEGIYGHQVGLELMGMVEARLSECLREAGLLYRLTSNEFVIVLKDIESSDDAAGIADRLPAHCNGVYQTAGTRSVSGSVTWAPVRHPSRDIPPEFVQVIDSADDTKLDILCG